MANVGDLKVLLTADDKASSTVKSAGSNIRTTAMNIGKTYAVLGGIIAGVFGASVKSFMDTGDKLHKMSLRTLISVETLERLHHIAELSGTSLDMLGNMVVRMRDNVALATDGNKTAIEAFETLGLTMEDIAAMKNEELFLKILDALAGVTHEETRMTTAMDIFGKRMGTFVLPIVAAGVKGLEDMAVIADKNARFTTEMANEAALLTDKMFEMQGQIAKASARLAFELAPAMLQVIEGFAKTIDIISKLAEKLNVNLPTAITGTVIGINAIRTALLMMSGALGLATGGISIAIGALITAGVWFATTEGSVTMFQNALRKVWNFMVKHFKPAIEFVFNAIIDRINLFIRGYNMIAKVIGMETIPVIDKFVAKTLEMEKVVTKATIAFDKETEKLQQLALTEDLVTIPQTKRIEIMEELTAASQTNTDANKKNADSVVELGNAIAGLNSISTGAPAKSMAQIMAAFPSLHSGQAQSEYRAALAMMASRRKGAGDGPIDIAAEVAKHGAFSNIGGMSGTTHSLNVTNINAVTGAQATKLLYDIQKRGLNAAQ